MGEHDEQQQDDMSFLELLQTGAKFGALLLVSATTAMLIIIGIVTVIALANHWVHFGG